MCATSAEQRKRARVQALATELYAQHRDRLLQIACKHAATDVEAEEAVQDAFLQFINHYDPASGAPPLAWLTLTLKRKCWDNYRRLRLDRQVSPEPGSGSSDPLRLVEGYVASPSDIEASAERAEEVREARERFVRLKPDERTALGLFGLGYSYAEIGEANGWTYTKVNRCISEGRAALREGR